MAGASRFHATTPALPRRATTNCCGGPPRAVSDPGDRAVPAAAAPAPPDIVAAPAEGDPPEGEADRPDSPVHELPEEPLVAPPEKLRAFFTRPRMFLGFALSVMVAVLIARLFSLHLRHDIGVVRTQAHEPEFLAYAVLCVIAYLAADAAALVLLTRVHRRTVPLRPLLLLSLRANFVGGTTSFGGVEIPYQAYSLRKQGLSLTEATSVILVKGVVHTSVLVLVALTALLPATGSPITPLQRWFVIAAVVLMAIAWAAGSLWVRRPIGLEQLPERFHKNIHAAREAFGEYHHAGWRVWLRCRSWRRSPTGWRCSRSSR